MLTSIRARLLAWLLVPISLLVGFDIWITYANAEEMTTVIHDRMLLGSARMIGEHVTYEEGSLEAVVPPAALELFQSKAADHVYYRIATQSGELLAGYSELPAPDVRPEIDGWTFHNAAFRGNPVRIVSFVQPVFGTQEHGSILVEVAHTMRSRSALAREIVLRTVGQQLLLVLVVVAMLWLGLRRALAPVLKMSDAVRARAPGSLERLPVAGVPQELRSLVVALNDYVGRLERQMSAHSRFIGNAAHQLRTPLTLLGTQVTCALRSHDAAGKDEAVRSIRDTVQHSSRVVNQLLTMTVAESSVASQPRLEEVDLGLVVKTVLEQHASIAQAREIDLGFESPGGRMTVRAVPQMLHELVANIVDNALRYTSAGGVVTAKVCRGAGGVALRIEDNGSGIPASERERVFERFYRLRHDASDGCGLGLAIVREIALAHGASVALGDAAGGGLVVTVTFRAPQFAAEANSVV